MSAPIVQGGFEYAFPVRAMQRWAGQYLRLSRRPDGVSAVFHFEGGNCAKTIILRFEYCVELRRDGQDYVIEQASCKPLDGDNSYKSMCEFIDHGDGLMHAIVADAPMVGRSLDEAARWRAAAEPSACLCKPEHRVHKWQIVFQTIHWALNQERQ